MTRPARSIDSRMEYSEYGAGMVASTWAYLDITALGRQEDWEEPKGRSESVRAAATAFSGLGADLRYAGSGG